MATDRCIDCDIGVMQFFHKYVGQTKDLVDFCIRHKLVLDTKECEVRGKEAVLDVNKKQWRCQKKVLREKKNTLLLETECVQEHIP